MALNAYLQQVQLLLGDPIQAKFNVFDLTTYVNTARNQIAAATECVREFLTISTTANVRTVSFSGFTAPTGASGVLKVRLITQTTSGNNMVKLQNRPFEWFLAYNMSAATAAVGTPNTWAQYGQGSNGSIYLDPIPSSVYTLNADCVCTPSPLALDTDPELIGYPWTDAIPYYAAYFALLTAQQLEAAQQMFTLYQLYTKNAMSMANPSVLPDNFPGHAGFKGAAQAMPITGVMAAQGGKQ